MLIKSIYRHYTENIIIHKISEKCTLNSYNCHVLCFVFNSMYSKKFILSLSTETLKVYTEIYTIIQKAGECCFLNEFKNIPFWA